MKNLSVQLYYLRIRHEEKINEMGFPMESKSALALPLQGGYSIPKKKFAAMLRAKGAMDFSSPFLHKTGVGRNVRESSPDLSESKFNMVDELNFCKYKNSEAFHIYAFSNM